MYITPNTDIYLLSGVPLDENYNNTIYFNSPSEQESYFKNYVYTVINSATYQRTNTGTIKVELPRDLVLNCNYMMFKNTDYSYEWIYAFIHKPEYISNNTTEIYFTVDVLQTYHFRYNLRQCFVEREHSVSDFVGDNTVPEQVDLGNYITTSSTSLTCGALEVWAFAITIIEGAATVDRILRPGNVGGFPMACFSFFMGDVTDPNTYTNIGTFVDAYEKEGKVDNIVGFCTMPSNFNSTTSETKTQFLELAKRRLPKIPRNNKLYTYPYCGCCLFDGSHTQELAYEMFLDPLNPVAEIKGGFGAATSVSLTPQNYEGYSEAFPYQMAIKNFPMVAWSKEYFQNWWAQNGTRTSLSTGLGVLGGVGGLALAAKKGKVGIAITAVTAIAASIANTIGEITTRKAMPDSTEGSNECSDVNAVEERVGFYSYCRTVKEEYLNIIDDYFDHFGYATHLNKIPNRNVRPYWTYVKTIGCLVTGNLPSNVAEEIQRVYDKGVTWWTTKATVGDYSQDNRANERSVINE